jgi:hypothetical protein
MVYVDKWERLSEASTRVMETAGISKDEAQTDICRAIADGGIKIRCKLGRHSTKHFTSADTELEGEAFQVPTNLRAEDFDWERSRPLKPWPVRTHHHRLPGLWHLECIKLSRTDVTNVLCPTKEQEKSTQHGSADAPATSTSWLTLEGKETPVSRNPRSAARPRSPDTVGSARPRGPRPKKFEQARDAMRNDLQQGRLTAAGLETMLEKALAADYRVSRDTARKARKAVLSELGEN